MSDDHSPTDEPEQHDPRLDEPGSEGMPGPLEDTMTNMPGSHRDPEMNDTEMDPEQPISSAKGTNEPEDDGGR